MAFIPAPGIAQVAYVGTWGGLIDIRTIMHVRKAAEPLGEPFTGAELALAANRMAGAWDIFLSSISTAYGLDSVDMRALDSEAGIVTSLPTSLEGDETSANTGPFTCVVVRWRTGLAGRTNGRTYLPGVNEAGVDQVGQLTTPTVDERQTQADNFLDFVEAPTDTTHPGPPLQLVILSTKGTGTPSERTASPVVAASIRNVIGIQRRRRVAST